MEGKSQLYCSSQESNVIFTAPSLKDPLCNIVFMNLDIKSLISLRQTCKYFKQLVFSKEDNNLKRFLHRYWNVFIEDFLELDEIISSFAIVEALSSYQPNLLFTKFPFSNCALDQLNEENPVQKLCSGFKNGELWIWENQHAKCFEWNGETRKIQEKFSIKLSCEENPKWVGRHKDKILCFYDRALRVFTMNGQMIEIRSKLLHDHIYSFFTQDDDGLVYVIYSATDLNSHQMLVRVNPETYRRKAVNLSTYITNENCSDGVFRANAIKLPDGTPCFVVEERGTGDRSISLLNLHTMQTLFVVTCEDQVKCEMNYNGTWMLSKSDEKMSLDEIVEENNKKRGISATMWEEEALEGKRLEGLESVSFFRELMWTRSKLVETATRKLVWNNKPTIIKRLDCFEEANLWIVTM